MAGLIQRPSSSHIRPYPLENTGSRRPLSHRQASVMIYKVLATASGRTKGAFQGWDEQMLVGVEAAGLHVVLLQVSQVVT